MRVNIIGLDKARLLAALFNNASPLFAVLKGADMNRMTPDEARAVIVEGDRSSKRPFESRKNLLWFDCVRDRPLHVDLSGDSLDTALYDRYQGHGEGARVVGTLFSALDAASPLGAHEYRCSTCFRRYIKSRADAEAAYTARALGYREPPDAWTMICDECYNRMKEEGRL